MYSGPGKKIKSRFFYHNIRIIEKLPNHNVKNNQIFTKVTKKIESENMEKFSATISTEELKAKAKNANTTKSTSQWLLVCLSWTELRNKEQEIGA